MKWQRREIFILIILVLVGIALRLYKLSSKSFWIDEYGTYADAMDILNGHFWRRTHFLSFFLVRLSLLMGYNEFTLRFPSFLFGVLSIPAIYIMLKRWFEKKEIAILGSLLVCVSVYQLYFAHEARYYTEMTFFSALSLYLFYRILMAPRITDFTLWIIISMVNYGIHPTGGVLWGAQVLFWMAYFIMNEKYRVAIQWIRKGSSRPGILVLEIAILCVGLVSAWIGWRYLFGGYVRQVIMRLAQIPHIPLTPGVGFKLYFFLSPIMRFSFVYGNTVVYWVGYFFTFFFIWGLIQGFKRYRWQTVFVIWAYIFTYTLLFLFKADITFTEKYVIFLYPLFASAVCIGMLTFFESLLSHVKRVEGRWWSFAAALLALFLLQFSQWEDYYIFYSYETQPYRSALDLIMKQGGKVGKLIITPHGNAGFRHYAPEYGIDLENVITVQINPNDTLFLKRGLRSQESVWFCPLFGFGEKYDMATYNYIMSFFRRVGNARSSLSKRWDIPVYRFLPGRVVFAGIQNPIPIRFPGQDIGRSPFIPIEMKKTASGNWVGEDTFTIMDATRYGISLEGAPDMLGHFRVSREYDDTMTTGTLPVAFPEGPVKLLIFYNGPELSADSRATISWTNPVPYISAIYYDRQSPLGQYEALYHEGKTCYALKKNGYVTYNLDISEEGRYQFEVEGVNDKPLPVFVEVSMNQKALGVLSFHEQNNKFSAKSFTEFLNKGKNTLTFYFLNDNLDGSVDLTDQNVDFIFSGFSYGKIAAGEEERSDFLPSSDFIHPDVPGSFVLPDDTKKLNPFWELNGNGKMLIEKVQDKLNLHCIIPYDSQSLTIVSKPVPAVLNKILYCSVQMKSENMANHSANVMFVYIDAGNKMLGRVWVHPTGITGNSPWIRFPCLRPVPEDARYVIIVISVYPNGNRPGRASEDLWISDFKFLPQNM